MNVTPIAPQSIVTRYNVTRKVEARDVFVVSNTDQVELSETARMASSAARAVRASFATADQDAKIRRISEQIKAGTYSVSAEQVAEKVLSNSTLGL